MAWRIRLANFLGTDFGRGCAGLLIALLVFLPAILFRLPGFTFVIGGIFGLWGGYSFARYEWRRLGFVPKYDDTTPRENINDPSIGRKLQPPQRRERP